MPRLSEIYLASGRNKADSILRTAAIEAERSRSNAATWGNAAQTIAGNLAGVVQGYQQQKAEAPARALAGQEQIQRLQKGQLDIDAARTKSQDAETAKRRKQAIDEIMGPALTADGYDIETLTQNLTKAGLGSEIPDTIKSVEGVNAAIKARRQADLDGLGYLAVGVANLGNDPDVARNQIKFAQAHGLVKPADAEKFLADIDADPAHVAKITGALIAASSPEIQKLVKQPKLAERDPTKDLYDQTTGQVVTPGTPAPTKPPPAPSVGSFEDYVVRKFGPNPTPKQIEQAKASFAEAGRDPTPGQQTASGLPIRVESQVQAKTRAFGTEPVVRRTQTMAEAVSFINSLDPKSSNPADDQALIYAFAKAMDPDSVVREGEYATVQKYAQSWLENQKFNAMRVIQGSEFLSPQARENMKKTITAKFEAGRKQYDNLATQYGHAINKITGKDDGPSYLIDYGAAFPQGTSAPPPRPASVPATAIWVPDASRPGGGYWKAGG